MSKLNWGTPPEPARRGPSAATLEILSELQANPGQWARLVGRVSLSAGARWRKLGCETRNERTEDPKKVYLWVRWPEQ